MIDKSVRGVLFVCLGNICRSPAAEGVLQHLVAERGLQGRVFAGSAGTSRYHLGEPADPRMQEAATRRGYVLTSISRQITREDFDRFDLIVAMDRENLRDLRALEPRPRGISCPRTTRATCRIPTSARRDSTAPSTSSSTAAPRSSTT